MIYDIFKIGVYQKNLNCNLQKLTDFSEWCEKNTSSAKISNLTGYQSNNLDLSQPIIKDLIEKLNKSVEDYCDELKINGNLKLSNVWVNINRYKDSNIIHRHPSSIISGVFYINTPNNCGDISFITNDNIDEYWSPNDKKEYNQYNSPSWDIPARENFCVLFPSWLKHMVKPNFNKTENRISMSFNYNYSGI